ncbi:GNAT family protein [Actinopolymorpha sp. B11F2]|uniref:GNAT family N-acetyltransferase n=1 Tax=Actinopolymorpha sp. B11F2 TaxID=3160862 RepID=UPI0032E4A51E
MLTPDCPIETDRLLLRPFTPDDHDALFDIQRRADVARYLYWEPRRAEEMPDVLAKRISQSCIRSEGDALALAVVRRDTGALVGDLLVFWVSREHRLGEIGYVFHPDHGGQGFATEAAEVALRLGFEGLGLHRMIGRLDARNVRSARLLERLGMRREAHFVENEYVKGEWTDEVVYAMVETEWRATRARDDTRVSRAPTP